MSGIRGVSGWCAIVAVVLLASTSWAGLEMRGPMTYLIDYDTQQRFVNDPATIAAFAEAPPDLVHVGKTVPILHNWGAVPLMVGENQFTGGPGHTLDWDAIRLLEPEELEARIARLEQFTADWHNAGVPTLIPYTSIHTIAGDHEKRLGFWAFYDHWADYEKWLGPRPEEDPFAWLMVDKDGRFVPGACGGYAPDYYAPLHRYRVCPNHPAWRRLQTRLTELIAEVGYDGVFVDNAGPANVCFCRHCKEGFKRFAAGLSEEERTRMGIEGDPARFELDGEDTPAELARRYRIASYADYLRMVRAAGSSVKPGFWVFPNVNRFQEFMGLWDSCDFFMFESCGTPGYRLAGALPEDPQLTIRVAEATADDARTSYHLHFAAPATFVEMDATIDCPKIAELGQPATLSCAIARVGASNQDGDWAEDFALILSEVGTEREERIALTPEVAVGGASLRPEAKRPPITLRAEWTPDRPGRFRVALAYRYTDPAHLEATRDLVCLDPLCLDQAYRTHIGELLFTMHSPARAILLDYPTLRKGAGNLCELGMAECAAFSNGNATATKGAPQRKYAGFFKRTRSLYEGARPYADIGLLYGYWGYNPGGMRQNPAQTSTLADDLAASHRLLRVLMDKTLSPPDLAALTSLVICGSKLEMTEPQVAALRSFADAGGHILLYAKNGTLNGQPVQDVLPAAEAWHAGATIPGMPPLIATRGLARGLRFAASANPRTGRRLVLHVVNYNVSVHADGHPVEAVDDIEIQLPLPKDFAVAAVRLHTPEEDTGVALPFQVQAGLLTFTLPRVRIYAVLELVPQRSENST